MNPLEIPHLTRYVNDFSHIFSEDQKNTLDALFSEHEKKTTEQVVTVFIPHREGNELLDIGLNLFNENGIGQKNLNNGILLIVSTEEKKLRIIVGKGLELKYTEMVCRDIVENHLRPLLNAGKYEEMVRRWGEISRRDGKNEIISITHTENQSNFNYINTQAESKGGTFIKYLIFILIPVGAFYATEQFAPFIYILSLGSFWCTIIFIFNVLEIKNSMNFPNEYIKLKTRLLIKSAFISFFYSVILFLCAISLPHCTPLFDSSEKDESKPLIYCERNIGKYFQSSYTTSSSFYDPSSHFSSFSDSSYSFGGGGGSSNGGGYGD